MKIKILNLNLWNYTKWKTRKSKVINFIKKNNPDIVVLQEIRDDVKFNKKGDHQGKQLKKALGFPYMAFYSVTDKRKERPGKYRRFCREGIAILSKYPIIEIKRKQLKRQKEDRYTCGNLYVKIKIKGKIVEFLAVHFSNSDLFSLLHLIETISYIKKNKINPIIVGDFNMPNQDKLNELTEDNFKSSMNYKKYMSYPIRKWTLDYILIPKKYKFKSFECIGRGLSDHKALVAEVEV